MIKQLGDVCAHNIAPRNNSSAILAKPRRFVSLLAGVAAISLTASFAHSATLTDTYSGGYNTYNSPGDVIGTQTFDITSAVVTRSGPGNNTLNVTVNTYYAGAPGTPAADGTGYGSLFFSTNPVTLTGSSPYPNDQYTQNRWNYAFTVPQNPGSGSIGPTSGGLYSIGSVTNTNAYGPNPAVVQSYTTQSGIITMSNVNGDPVTYPGANNPGFYFRQGQAVQYTPTNANDTVGTGSWSVVATAGSTEGAIIFSIVDNGLLGNSFILDWAMTCANDVILGPVTLTGNEQFPTPLPAALPLFAGGLGVMGFLIRHRKKSLAA